jgi:DegV family protein with EDD domain
VTAAAAPRIRYLNGLRFRRALIAGARQLIENRERINSINVFPVADGDTGSNMAGTLGFIVNGIIPSKERAIDRMLRSVADLALSGARGCSGTIMAQFFHGLAQELAHAVKLTTRAFGQGVRKAVAYPWEAVSEPREGTILTVLRDWGNTVYEWSSRTDDFVELLQHAYRSASKSLAHTRETLSVLTIAGVVDAGAQGLVHMLAGITKFISAGRIGELDARATEEIPEATEIPGEAVENPEFRYCTQFVLEGSDIDVGRIRTELSGMGNSLIVAGSAARAKIHIHSNSPGLVFQNVVQHGDIAAHRVEDMRAQYRAAHTPHPDIAIAVDSACDLPSEVIDTHTLHIVPCILNLDGKSYFDKLSITPEILFSLQRAALQKGSHGHATTSQPSPADFQGRYEFLRRHYKSVVSLSMSSGISGTFDSARTGAKLAGSDINVIDTKSVSMGLGLLVRSAAEAVEHGATREEVVALVNRLIPRVRIHFAVRTLENLMRSGRISRMKGMAANLLHLKPILRLNADTQGKVQQGETVFGVKGGRKKILRLMEKEIDPRVPIEFGIAHANAEEDAMWFRDRITERFTLARPVFVSEVTSVLAAHIGEGAVGVGYILPERKD